VIVIYTLLENKWNEYFSLLNGIVLHDFFKTNDVGDWRADTGIFHVAGQRSNSSWGNWWRKRGTQWRGFKMTANRNYAISTLNFSTESLVNSTAFLKIVILSLHSLCSKEPSPERSRWVQSLKVSSRWREIRSSAILFFSLSIGISPVVFGGIQVSTLLFDNWILTFFFWGVHLQVFTPR